MSSIAIEVEGLSKRYRIGERQPYYRATEVLTALVGAPFRAARRRLSQWSAGQAAAAAAPQEFWALRDISFQLPRGEVLGVIGRNGAGKSTLLKILSRITEPTAGRAVVRGRVGSLLEVGTGFHPELTGRENIFLNGAILGMSRAEIRGKFDQIVDFAEVSQFLDTPVKRYSSGMYMRLAFAVAAHLDPEILVVDEVLAVGDAEFQKKCLGKMGEVARGGRTVLFVSHNMGAIQTLCPTSLLLDRGRLVCMGPSREVIDRLWEDARTADQGMVAITAATPRVNSSPSRWFAWEQAAILNAAGQPAANILFGEPFSVALSVQATARIEHVQIGFALATPMGSPVFNAWQVDAGQVSALEPGRWTFRATIEPNLLAPGLYELHLGAVGTGITEWLPNVLRLHVDQAAWQGVRPWTAMSSGSYRQPCAWQTVPMT